MDLIIRTQDKAVINFMPQAPAAYHRYRIPGAKEYYAKDEVGTFLFYEQPGEGFSIWCHHYQVKQQTVLNITPVRPLFRLVVALNHSFRCQQAVTGKLSIPEGRFNIVYSPATEYQLSLEKGKKYVLYEVQVSRPWLEKLLTSFALLTEFLMKADLGVPGLLNTTHARLTPAMMTMLNDLMHCVYTGQAREAYLEALLSRLLLQAIARLAPSRTALNEVRLQTYELNKLREAWDYLLRNVDHQGTVSDLSHAIGLNEFKLKRGFKQVYGITIFEFLLEARMEKAKRLLQQTDMTVHAVAISVGYKNISSFTVAFKKKFRILPSEMRS